MNKENAKNKNTGRAALVVAIAVLLLALLGSCNKANASQTVLPGIPDAVIDDEAVPLAAGSVAGSDAAEKGELEQAWEEVVAAANENEAAAENVNNRQEELDKAAADLEDAQEKLAEAEKALEEAEAAKVLSDEELEQARQEAEDAQKALEDAQRAAEDAQRELEQAQASYDDAVAKYGRELAALKALVSVTADQMGSLARTSGKAVNSNDTANAAVINGISEAALEDSCFAELAEENGGYYWRIYRNGVASDMEHQGFSVTYMPSEAEANMVTVSAEESSGDVVLRYFTDGGEGQGYYAIADEGGVKFTGDGKCDGKTVDAQIQDESTHLSVEQVDAIIAQLKQAEETKAALEAALPGLNAAVDEAAEADAAARDRLENAENAAAAAEELVAEAEADVTEAEADVAAAEQALEDAAA